jgi:hypothetical protein
MYLWLLDLKDLSRVFWVFLGFFVCFFLVRVYFNKQSMENRGQREKHFLFPTQEMRAKSPEQS